MEIKRSFGISFRVIFTQLCIVLLNSYKLKIVDLKTETPSLEDVFLEKTGRSLTEDTAIKIGSD